MIITEEIKQTTNKQLLKGRERIYTKYPKPVYWIFFILFISVAFETGNLPSLSGIHGPKIPQSLPFTIKHTNNIKQHNTIHDQQTQCHSLTD